MPGRLSTLFACALLCGALLAGLPSDCRGESSASGAPPGNAAAPASPIFFKICRNQTYALCATASCTVFNQVAYCNCDVKKGDSISLPLKIDGEDVCSVNAQGPENGYMVSTFSLPDSVRAPSGNRALYTCPAGTSDGAYAQCDGGICFTSSEGKSFPGFEQALGSANIICACPITLPGRSRALVGYQIAGPYPCDNAWFRYCKSAAANTRTGSTVMVGAPTGTPGFLTRRLYGSVPPLQRCPAPGPNGR